MKRNALIRIILWSIVIAILTTIMVGVGFGVSFNRNRRTDRTEAVLVTTPPEASITPDAANAVVTADALNIRKSPTSEAEVVGHFEKNEAIRVTRVETVNGVEWAYVAEPYTGWVMRKYLDMKSDVPQETMVAADVGRDTFPASAVRELDIEWATGDIKIYPGTTDQITVSEDGDLNGKYTTVIHLDGDSLEIRFSDRDINVIGLGSIPEKDLTITVPVDWYCQALEIEAASATVDVSDLTMGEVSIETASGKSTFENCTVEAVDIGTASGDVRFIGSLNILDCDAASAKINAVLSNVPRRLDLETMSGDLDLTLPAEAGFTLRLDSVSGDFTSDFQTSQVNGNHVAGDGACRIDVQALSGDVTIRKAQ